MRSLLALPILGVLALPALAVPPNIVVIVTDDQRADTLSAANMPSTMARIADAGIRFDRAYVTTPLCAPSRASILTGQYAHTHGVVDNAVGLGPAFTNMPKFPKVLHDAGYRTALVGKYMNQWDGPTHPAAYDHWTAIPGGGVGNYFDYDVWEGVTQVHKTQYITDYFRDRALTFLDNAHANHPTEPVLLLFTPNAPHGPAQPKAGDGVSLPPWRPESFNEADVSDKPPWLANTPKLGAGEVASSDAFRLGQLGCLKSVDRAVSAILDRLDAQGRLANTVVFLIGDNGFFWAEHRLTGKNRVYEEAVRVPFTIRDFRAPAAGRVDGRLVANIDIAPTIYELAGVAAPTGVEGRSLVPLLTNANVAWRSNILLEGVPAPNFSGIVVHDRVQQGCNLVDRYEKYVESSLDELYRTGDPLELTNRAQDPACTGDPACAASLTRYRDLLRNAPH
jgi:arylsulfatase A-like enzyme